MVFLAMESAQEIRFKTSLYVQRQKGDGVELKKINLPKMKMIITGAGRVGMEF